MDSSEYGQGRLPGLANWRDLPPGRELDRLIVEAQGRVVDYEDGDEIWLFGKHPGWRDETPHYSTDVNDALTLPVKWSESDDLSWCWMINIYEGGEAIVTLRFDYIEPEHFDYQGTSKSGEPIAVAFCRAWLEWKMPH